MRILQVNKFFRPGAGAETAFFQTRALLASRGHEVVDFAMRESTSLPSPQERFFAPERSYADGGGVTSRVRDAASAIYSRGARQALARLLDAEPVDVAHLHNIYHQLTLSIVDELAARRIPMVLTLHDWKITCPSYTLFTEGAPCRRCVERGPYEAVVHRCVKGSRAGSAVAAAEAVFARTRGSYGKVQRVIAPSRFAAEVAGLGGVPADRVDVIPNFLPDEELRPAPPATPREPVLFFGGRLEATKGVRRMLEAFARVPAPVRLRIAGSGELEGEVAAAAATDDRIEVLGRVSRERIAEECRRSAALVLPSIWEDNCPMVLLEAQVQGAAAIVSDRGGPKEFVRDGRDGLVVDPDDVGALAAAMTRLGTDPGFAAACGASARERVVAEHDADRHFERLMAVYRNAAGMVPA